MNKKHLIVAGAATTLGLFGVGGASLANAATTSNGDSSSLVEKIASKFNLNKDDVQKVFDEDKTAREAERQKEFSDRLQDRVDSGDITAQQKTLIENKFKELQTKRQNAQKDLEKWADDNNIDIQYLRFGYRIGGDSNSDYLDQLVKDGKITSAQKTLIENKQKELKNKIDSELDALKKWADDNNINLEDVMPFGGRGGMRGGFGPH